MSDDGHIKEVQYPPDSSYEVISHKKILLGILSSKLQLLSERDEQQRWAYQLEESTPYGNIFRAINQPFEYGHQL